MDILEEVEQRVRARVFSYNKAASKNQVDPVYLDMEKVTQFAMDHLIEALTDLALEETDLEGGYRD